ncbi:hypothetical protein [Nonomuraea sp. NPDC002799]
MFGLLTVLIRSDLSKDVELLVLRQENQVRPAGDISCDNALITARSAHVGRGLATCRRNTAN